MSDESHLLKKVEAALFISGRFLSVQELVMLTGINPLLVKELLASLKEKYSSQDSALTILTQAEKWKMDVKEEFQDIITKLASGKAEFSKAEQETLAVIAYKQPVKQSIVVKIRGNKSYEHIKRFMENGLIKYRKLGHTFELQLSEKFYDYFQIGKAREGEETNSI